MTRCFFAVILTAVLMLFGTMHRAAAEEFKPNCTSVAFDSIAERHPIDDDCGLAGVGQSEAHLAQNRAKNNFCAEGPGVRVTYITFLKLQRTVEQRDIPHGSSNALPPDRGVLQNLYRTSDGASIGEGSLVRFAAFVIDAHYSNVHNGESVNCKKGGEENNDIHIALARSADEADLCNSVTAEISPHLRPSMWQPENLNHLHHPVRLTGQLFFDGSHQPCVDDRGSPRRASVWEIHPVYAIDVCRNKTLAACKNTDDESLWVPLHKWLNLEEEAEKPVVTR